MEKNWGYHGGAGVMILFLTPDEIVGLVNRKGQEILGYSEDMRSWGSRPIVNEITRNKYVWLVIALCLALLGGVVWAMIHHACRAIHHTGSGETAQMQCRDTYEGHRTPALKTAPLYERYCTTPNKQTTPL